MKTNLSARRFSRFNGPRRQQGSALAMGLVFLVILTLLGLTASTGSITQELIVRNIKDQNLAMQAAEMALREAETWLRNAGPLTPTDTPVIKVIGYCDTGNSDCANQDQAWWDANASPMGKLIESPPMTETGLNSPQFIIELFKVKLGCVFCSTTGVVNYYRITARGTGLNPSTVRILRSLYRW